jgi:hypothetical protein
MQGVNTHVFRHGNHPCKHNTEAPAMYDSSRMQSRDREAIKVLGNSQHPIDDERPRNGIPEDGGV